MAGERFPAQLRLRQRREFLAVQRLGTKHHTRNFLVFVRHEDQGCNTRLGVTVTKKVGNAVARNRAKRRLREVVSVVFPQGAVPGTDYVVIARRSAVTRPFDKLVADLEFALTRIWPGITNPTQGESRIFDRKL